MKTNKIFDIFMVFVTILGIVVSTSSCEPNTEFENDLDFNQDKPNSKQISLPKFDKYLTTTTTSDCSIRLRFTNGGDDVKNMSCMVYWRRYSTKPSNTPKKSDMNNAELMRVYDYTSTKTTFDKTHSGFNGGNYIYYYAICGNSKGDTETELTYCVIKR